LAMAAPIPRDDPVTRASLFSRGRFIGRPNGLVPHPHQHAANGLCLIGALWDKPFLVKVRFISNYGWLNLEVNLIEQVLRVAWGNVAPKPNTEKSHAKTQR
jgi:hypothetical protein